MRQNQTHIVNALTNKKHTYGTPARPWPYSLLQALETQYAKDESPDQTPAVHVNVDVAVVTLVSCALT